MTSPTGSRRAGLTLVEILVSVAVLSVAAVFLLGALGRAYSATAQTQARQEAYRFALSKMGEVERALRSAEELEEESEGSFREGIRLFRWVLSVVHEPAPDSGEDGQPKPGPGPNRLPRRRVLLTVRWEEGRHVQEQRVETVLLLPEKSP